MAFEDVYLVSTKFNMTTVREVTQAGVELDLRVRCHQIKRPDESPNRFGSVRRLRLRLLQVIQRYGIRLACQSKQSLNDRGAEKPHSTAKRRETRGTPTGPYRRQ